MVKIKFECNECNGGFGYLNFDFDGDFHYVECFHCEAKEIVEEGVSNCD